MKSPQCSSKQHYSRLMGCQVLKESFKIYCAISDGIINLDMFFDMPKYDAIKALAVYKRAGMQKILPIFMISANNLSLPGHSSFLFSDSRLHHFLQQWKNTSKKHLVPQLGVWSEESNLLTYSQEAPKEHKKLAEEEEEEPAEPEQQPQQLQTTADLLNLDEEVNPLVAEIEEHNALALAVVAPGDQNKASTCQDLFSGNTSGWELAMVNAPSSHTSQAAETRLAGGFDKLLLDSLYEDAARRQQIATVAYNGSLGQANPFNDNDPFTMSSSFAPPSNVQLAMMTQQKQYYQAQQQQYYQPQLPQQYFQAQQHQHQYFQHQLQHRISTCSSLCILCLRPDLAIRLMTL